MRNLLLVEGAFELGKGLQILRPTAEGLDQFDWRAEAVEGREFKHLALFDVDDAGVGVLVEQRFEYLARRAAWQSQWGYEKTTRLSQAGQ